jgi:hypothetical protein
MQDNYHHFSISLWRIRLCFLLLLLTMSTSAFGISDSIYRTGTAIFRLNAGHSISELDNILATYSASVIDSFPLLSVYSCSFADSIPVDSVTTAIGKSNSVLWAQPDYYIFLSTNDPRYSDQ